MPILPNNDQSCGWIQTLPPRATRPALSSDKRCKWVIIGAGYSGLSAALTLAEHLVDDEIILLDANLAGEGASSRNSGFLVDSTLNDGHLQNTGLTEYKSKYELNLRALETVKEFTKKYNIDCHWNECGRYYASANRKTENKLRAFNDLLNSFGIANTFVEGAELNNRLGTNFYKMAVKTQGGVLLQPAVLARGLVDALSNNVTLYENTTVTSITKGTPHTIKCTNHEIIADNLIVAVNGFMPSLGLKQNRVFPLLLTASLTRPLTPKEQMQMGSANEWGIISADSMGATIRYTHDKRLMIRNTVEVSTSLKMNSKQLAKRQKIHFQGLVKRFPFIPANIFEYCWSGITCISANNANIFEKVSNNYWLVGCYNGGGIGLSTLFGQQIAYQAMDKPQPVANRIRQRSQASWLPPQPFLNIGIKTKLAFNRFTAKADS